MTITAAIILFYFRYYAPILNAVVQRQRGKSVFPWPLELIAITICLFSGVLVLVQICKCETIGSNGGSNGSINGLFLKTAQCPWCQTNSHPKHLTEEKVIEHRTKDASPKCGFISCIRVRYCFSFSNCKHAFFHYAYLFIICPSPRTRRLEILCVI